MKVKLFALGLTLAMGTAQADSSQKAEWTQTGFQQPESALAAPAGDVIYVSNINGNPGEKNGRGYISRLNANGEPDQHEWVTGLNAPKGMGWYDNRLYVADIDRVVVIDAEDGTVLNEYPVKGAQFLNDITVDDSGRVYISDMLGNALYRIENGNLVLWLKSDALTHPNGLTVHNGALIVAAWGTPMAADFSTQTPGSLLSIDLNTRHIQTLPGGEHLGNLDGLVRVGDGYIISDWMTGVLMKLKDNGEHSVLKQFGPGLADIGGTGTQLILPFMNEGKVTTFNTVGF